MNFSYRNDLVSLTGKLAFIGVAQYFAICHVNSYKNYTILQIDVCGCLIHWHSFTDWRRFFAALRLLKRFNDLKRGLLAGMVRNGNVSDVS